MPSTATASPANSWKTPGSPTTSPRRATTQGISSIVEFNQAQLNLVAAQIAYANTQYEYLVQRSALSFQTGTLN